MTTYTDLCKNSLLMGKNTDIQTKSTTLHSMIKVLETWYERSRQRAALKELDSHILSDIGITRDEMELETAKPFWKA